MPRTPKSTDATTTADATLTPEQEAILAGVLALTPTPRTKGEPKNRNYFDTDVILKAASDLSSDATYLDLLSAIDVDDDDTLVGPKIRTRLSQLVNTGRLPSNFRPVKPKAKPLFLAIRAALAAGVPAEMIPGTPEFIAAAQEVNEAA